MLSKSTIPSVLCRYFYALYLFIRWDRNNMITILLFCTISGRDNLTVASTLSGVAWIWLHALFFCVSNQCTSAEEDAINKPYRPIPAGLVSYKEAIWLLLCLAATCIGFSAPFGAAHSSAGVIVSSLAYTFLKLDSHWLTKNVANAAIWYPFYLGALKVFDKTLTTGTPALKKLILLILTTIQAGDFPDVEGDKAVGRKTLPIVYPSFARISLIALIGAWSLYFPLQSASLYNILPSTGLVAAYSFVKYRNPSDEKRSTNIYNMWLTIMHVYFAYSEKFIDTK